MIQSPISITAPTSNSARVLAVLALMTLLAGCQRYEWTHPTKSLEQFGRDKYTCQERASRLYPVAAAVVQEGGGYFTGGYTQCRRSSGYSRFCYATPMEYIPPMYTTRDLNENERGSAVESCLFSRGYQLVPEN